MVRSAPAAEGGIAIVGARSGIGRALARRLASEGHALILAGRDLDELELIARDLEIRYGTKATARAFDAQGYGDHGAFLEGCVEHFAGQLDGLLLCHGTMLEQAEAEKDFAAARRMVEVNYLSMVSLLGPAATYFEQQGAGWICAISSVAGDRGRQGNYLYGSTKAALSALLSGLRTRLAKRGVRVIDVRPGFVDTALTFGLPGMFLVASPQKVAEDIVQGIRKNRAVVYTPFFWRGIMLIIRMIPDFVFRRLSI